MQRVIGRGVFARALCRGSRAHARTSSSLSQETDRSSGEPPSIRRVYARQTLEEAESKNSEYESAHRMRKAGPRSRVASQSVTDGRDALGSLHMGTMQRGEGLAKRVEPYPPFAVKNTAFYPVKNEIHMTAVSDGVELDSSVSKIWLRDHCQCDQCVHPETKQRLFDVFASDFRDLLIDSCEIDGRTVKIVWLDGHVSVYDRAWLENSFDKTEIVKTRQGWSQPKWWDEAFLRSPDVPYDAVMNTEEGLAEWLKKIHDYGFCFVDGCPPSPEATQKLIERIGPIRNTHYGGLWDFTSDLASKDTAYTDYALDPHTDSTYFTEPAGLQIFHLLSHEGDGGANQLIDGFRAAEKVKQTNPIDYEILSNTPIMAHASGNYGISIQPAEPCPVLERSAVTGELMRVRWNNYDRSQIVAPGLSQHKVLKGWYHAASLWNRTIKRDDKDLRYEVQLQPGRPLVFDNWRVLHGRSAFTGKRRMCGAYVNRDDYISRYKTSNFGYKEVLNRGIY